ncbi:MAG: hypothetical protein KAH28_09995 [Algiphilus sp.]|nr:hypothetical protein [Algiphilus sp.]
MLAACGGGGGGGSGTIDPGAEPDAVMQAILIKVGDRDASLLDGDPPAPTSTGNDPVLQAATRQVGVPSGGSASLSLDFETGSALSAIFAKVVGSDRYAEVLLGSETQSRSGTKALETVVLDIEVPSNIGAGEFCVAISGRDAENLVSNVDTVCFDVDNAVIDALQGTWDFACSPADDGSESFEGSWAFDGTDVTVTESVWPNGSCLGSPEDSYSEQLTVAVGEQVQAADGEPASEIDIRNLTEGGFFYSLVRVDGDTFQLARAPMGSGSSAEMRAVSFELNRTFTRPTDSVDPASACFNPVLWQDGTEYTESDRETEGGAFVGEFTSDFTVFTDSSFQGRPATRVFVQDSGTGLADANEYFQIDFEVPSINAIADENLQGMNDGFVSDPGELLRFDLAPGESYSYTSTYTELGAEVGDDGTATVTYVGRETITVPAGTFETCRFDLTTPDGYRETEWFGVGNGIEIAGENEGPGEPVTRTELLFAEINGEPIGEAPGVPDGDFSSLMPGTYAAAIDGDEQATAFELNEGGAGTWSFGEDGGSITWEVTEDGVLIIAFSGGGTERYTLTSGDTSAGTVLIEFSNEPDNATGTWTQL